MPVLDETLFPLEENVLFSCAPGSGYAARSAIVNGDDALPAG
jgi:hypothetical protein